MTGEAAKVIGRINRLRVFSAVKKYMEENGECPTIVEISDLIGMPLTTVGPHMRALHGATGLPIPITPGAQRTTQRLIDNDCLQDCGPPTLDTMKMLWTGDCDD